jgi:putative acetyltransferase
MRVEIVRAIDAESVDLARTLFREYADSLEFPLDFQGFDAELRRLPGDYAPPRGALLLARIGGRTAGCVGLRPIDLETCEMKRLYVRPAFRGEGVGRALAQAVVDEGRSLGYRRMRLDTVPAMDAAQRLYRSMGFRVIPPYRFNPVAGAVYLELDLNAAPARDDVTSSAGK